MDNENPSVPYGYCHCGCGHKTRIATQTRSQYQQVKGEPVRFLPHHQNGGSSSADRFKQRVRKQADGCWMWTGRKNSNGYGLFSLNGRGMGAHRAAYLLFIGDIPTDYQVDHLCRNRACVNPDHLEAVTEAENRRRAGMGSLSPDQAREVRKRIDAICAEFGIRPHTVAKIGNRETWVDLDG